MTEKSAEYVRTTTLLGNSEVSYDFKKEDQSESTADVNQTLLFTFSKEKQKIEVVFRRKSENYSVPDRVWKEIYGIVDGDLALINTIEGKHTPGFFTEETIVFEEPES